MAKKMCKCAICGIEFDRNAIQAVRHGARRYSHQTCEPNNTDLVPMEGGANDPELKKLKDYIGTLFGENANWAMINKQIKKYKEENPNTSILIITHHPKILEYLKPDFVHVMSKGKILETGDYSLANDIEKNGYNKYLNKENVITKEDNNE